MTSRDVCFSFWSQREGSRSLMMKHSFALSKTVCIQLPLALQSTNVEQNIKRTVQGVHAFSTKLFLVSALKKAMIKLYFVIFMIHGFIYYTALILFCSCCWKQPHVAPSTLEDCLKKIMKN